MADAALSFNDTTKEYDIAISSGDIASGSDLENAVIISLFTWARASKNEVGENSPQFGWWGDKIDEDSNYKIGSKLYLLKREKITDETIALVKDYAKSALQWLVDDGVASSVDVIIERNASDNKRVDGSVVVYKGTSSETLKFDNLWSLL